MDVVCKVSTCPYHTVSDFCKKRILIINQNGTCGHIYLKNGQLDPRNGLPHEQTFEQEPPRKEITEE